MKLYESDNQIVIRGINHNLIKEHLESNIQKILCIYDTLDNLLKDLKDYDSDKLVIYAIYDNIENEWIVERHKFLEYDNLYTNKPWGILGKSKQL